MSSPLNKTEEHKVVFYDLNIVTTERFVVELNQLTEEAQELVYSEFRANGFPGLSVDAEGYLRCAVLSVTQRGLFYAIDKRTSGLHLIALRPVRFTSPTNLESNSGSLDELILQAKQVGRRGKGMAALAQEMRAHFGKK